MLRLASDEGVNGKTIRGLRRQRPDLDLVTAEEAGLAHKGTPDMQVLEWAASEGRVLITEDVNTMVGFAWDRVRARQPMPGVIAVIPDTSIGDAIEGILEVASCCQQAELQDQVKYLPL